MKLLRLRLCKMLLSLFLLFNVRINNQIVSFISKVNLSFLQAPTRSCRKWRRASGASVT